jgi:hypothetical protein
MQTIFSLVEHQPATVRTTIYARADTLFAHTPALSLLTEHGIQPGRFYGGILTAAEVFALTVGLDIQS